MTGTEGYDLKARRALLIDLDDTLYDYAPAEHAARTHLLHVMAGELGLDPDALERAWDSSRAAVKARLGETGSSHSRLLYLVELVHALGRPSFLARVRHWERKFWQMFLAQARLRPSARELLVGFRAKHQGRGKVAIVTDLVLEVQLWKLEVFGLFDCVDVLVVSEEVRDNKPAIAPFELAMQRLGVGVSDCIMVGDNDAKDGGGARALGIPYLRALASDGLPGGMTMNEIGRTLGVF